MRHATTQIKGMVPASAPVVDVIGALTDAARELSLAHDLDSVMAVVKRAARDLTGADGATFILRENDVCFYAEENAIEALWKGRRLPISVCVSGWAMLNHAPAIIEDIYADPRVPIDVYRDTFVKSMVIVPIRTSNPIGAIGNYWATRHRATAVQVRLLQALADLTSVALENVQLYTELRKRIEEARLGEQRQAFLARATALLASSIEYEQTLSSIGKLVVPELADWYAVDLVVEERIVQVALEHADPRKIELARELRSRYAQPNDTTRGSGKAIHTGEPEIAQVTDELLEQNARDAEHLAILRDLGLRSYMVVPLKHSQGVIGAMALVSERADRQYGPADLELVMELARRCAAAIENARLYKQAQDAIRSRDEFLSIAAHELRTPLTALHLQLQSLADLARAAPVDERLASRGVRAVANMQRLTNLVDELLDVSRLTLGKLTLSPERFDLAACTREMVERFREPAVRAGSAISVAAPEPVEGSWDRFRTEQVVTNLLSNAMKYGAGKPIELTVTESGDMARLEVRDHGIGLSPEDTRRIFDRFERAVPMRHYGGLGLGLYICRQIVEAHGGRIWAEGEPGVGARFVVELPRGTSTTEGPK